MPKKVLKFQSREEFDAAAKFVQDFRKQAKPSGDSGSLADETKVQAAKPSGAGIPKDDNEHSKSQDKAERAKEAISMEKSDLLKPEETVAQPKAAAKDEHKCPNCGTLVDAYQQNCGNANCGVLIEWQD